MTGRPALLAAVFVLIGALPGPAMPREPQSVPLRDLLRRAGTWVERFAEDSAFIVAEERYEQEYRFRNGSSWQAEHRDLLSEIVLVRTPEDEARRGYPWVQFRDVIEVDGQALPDHRGRLERLFKEVSGSSYSRARALIEESACFNIGPFVREMNVPSFVLFFLHPRNQSRFRFELKGSGGTSGLQTGGSTVVTYRERERPTMIRSVRREDRPARGSVWIDGATGRVLKTDLEVDSDRHWVTETEVTYGRDARLDLWVPMVMRERHHRDSDEYIECTATYSGFRRFETNARMVVPRQSRITGVP